MVSENKGRGANNNCGRFDSHNPPDLGLNVSQVNQRPQNHIYRNLSTLQRAVHQYKFENYRYLLYNKLPNHSRKLRFQH